MDASGRQRVFDVAWLAHQRCCHWSAGVMQQDEVRSREKKAARSVQN
jgi:hypothetical protein